MCVCVCVRVCSVCVCVCVFVYDYVCLLSDLYGLKASPEIYELPVPPHLGVMASYLGDCNDLVFRCYQ